MYLVDFIKIRIIWSSMKILLLSAYSAQSHQTWCKYIMEMFPEIKWTLLSLSGRYFNWRIRGNALSWSVSQRQILNEQYDMVLATSMVDCATLRGLVPNLANIPWVVYFHENQFEYPVSSKNEHTEPKMVSLYNALCAKTVIFNSQYNYQTFVSGLEAFLKMMPDEVPRETIPLITEKSVVIPVPVKVKEVSLAYKKDHTVPVLLWNHRWEYDKGPQQLYNVINELLQRKFSFKLNLVGQQFRKIPVEFTKIKQEFPDVLLNYGYIDSVDEYQSILKSSDFVLSTALHDFQGLAILEAVTAGCIPVVPLRLAYPENFPEQYCYYSNLSLPEEEAVNMANKIIELNSLCKQDGLDIINISRFDLERLKPQYAKILFDNE